MKQVDSFNVQIWVGLRVQYSDVVHSMDDVREIVDEYIDAIKDCVTITPTEFRYVDGNEPGVIVGFINYPRFPRTHTEIYERAEMLAKHLMYGLNQYRVSITTPDRTIMLENENL